jgi:hypothetical protein
VPVPAVEVAYETPHLQAVAAPAPEPVAFAQPEPEPVPSYAASASDPAWVSHLPNGSSTATVDPQTWS